MGVWKQIAALPNPRYAAAAVFHAGKVHVLGGQAAFDSGFTNTHYIYDPVGNTWSTGAALPSNGLAYAFSTADDGVHLVYPATGAHYAYDLETSTWATRTKAPGPTVARAHHFVDADGRFYLAGGSPVGGGTTSVKVHRYLSDTDSWSTLTDMPGSVAGRQPTVSPGIVGADGKVYLGEGSFTRTLAVYDPTAGTWAVTADLPSVGVGVSPPIAVGVSRLPSGVVLALPYQQALGIGPTSMVRRVDGYDTATGTWAMGATPDFPASTYQTAVATEPGGIIYLLGGLVNGATGVTFATAESWSYKQNEAPTAPTPRTLTGGVTVSTESANRASWTFNDPNAGDSQSAFNFYYRPTGTTTWTVVNKASPNPWYDFAAGTLDPVEYEWQVETYDAAGEISPRTTSAIFTAADPPVGPSITYPINGQTVEQIETIVWSAPAQDAYQLRRVADVAGEPNAGVVYFDTGEVAEPLTRSLAVSFDVNDRFEHVQVRVKKDGLWSVWASVQVDVSYTPPPTPTFTVYPDPSTGSLLAMITNPAPGEDVPAAAYNDVHVDDGDGWERKATELPTNTGWRYWTPRSGRDYTGAIRVVAVAANGTTSTSA